MISSRLKTTIENIPYVEIFCSNKNTALFYQLFLYIFAIFFRELNMRNIFKNKIIIIGLIVISLGWVNLNIFYFGHYHINEDGSTIFHAHPYQKEKHQSRSFPNHSHTKSELLQLAIMIEILSSFVLFFHAIYFALNRNKRTHLIYHFITLHIFHYGKILKRGPPLFLQFS